MISYKKIRLAPPPQSLIEMRGELRTPYNVHKMPSQSPRSSQHTNGARNIDNDAFQIMGA
jgi:hypothetical protein